MKHNIKIFFSIINYNYIKKVENHYKFYIFNNKKNREKNKFRIVISRYNPNIRVIFKYKFKCRKFCYKHTLYLHYIVFVNINLTIKKG